jgi:hypothetical protein
MRGLCYCRPRTRSKSPPCFKRSFANPIKERPIKERLSKKAVLSVRRFHGERFYESDDTQPRLTTGRYIRNFYHQFGERPGAGHSIATPKVSIGAPHAYNGRLPKRLAEASYRNSVGYASPCGRFRKMGSISFWRLTPQTWHTKEVSSEQSSTFRPMPSNPPA